MKIKSKLRVVPTMHPKFGECWAVLDGYVNVGTYANRQSAELKKTLLEKSILENFLLESTMNQKLKIEDNEK